MLADGMGGHSGGEVASSIVVRETIKAYANTPRDMDARSRLRQAIVQANDKVLSAAASGAGPSDMGSTVVACTLHGRRLVIGHVGDSRAYLLRDGTIRPLTRDHNYPTEVLKLSREEADRHPMKHVITRVMGRAGTEPYITELTFLPEDRLLLCSDGVSNVVTETELHNALRQRDPAEAVRSIINLAKRRAEDNITAIVIYGVPRDVKVPPRDKGKDDLVKAAAAALLALVLLVAIIGIVSSKATLTNKTPASPVDTNRRRPPPPSSRATLTNETASIVTIRELCSTGTGERVKPGKKWEGPPGKYCLTLNEQDYDVDLRSHITVDANMANARKRSVVRF